MNNEIIEMEEIIPSALPMAPQNEKLKNHWSDGSTSLLAKWERICAHRKKAHYSASNDYGWKNKFLSIPIIVISTILGSLSFIHPSFIDKAACSRRLSLRNLQPEWPTCVCNSYLDGASGSDLCQKMETTECYPTLGGPCPTDMYECINVVTEAPTFDDCPAGGFCIPCGTCHPGRCDDNSCPLFDGECTCADGSCPSNVDSSICSPPTFSPTTFAPTSPAERCENYCQNSCAQFGTPEDNVSECQGCDSSKACHPGASNYNSVDAWCTFYACDSVNSRCDNWRCIPNAPTTTPTSGVRIIYDEDVSGEASNSGNGGVDTLPLVSGTNRIRGALKSPSVSDYYNVRAPDGGATITAMRLTMAGDGSNGVRSAYLRFFDTTSDWDGFVGQTGGGLIASVPANAVSMLEAPSSFSPSASGFTGWAHGQSDFLFMLSYGSASGMMDNAYIIDIDCVISPTSSPTTTKTPTTTPTTSPSPPFEGKSGDGEEENSENCEIGNCHIVEESNDCAVDEKMVAICNSDGSWADSCILNNNIHESCFEETPTTSPTPPFEGKSGKSGDSEGDGDGEECAPGCPDDWPGDGVCDDSCFNSACNYDDGDCPTASPTKLPTTSSPTQQPSREPTRQPSREPTQQPSREPTRQPSREPTQQPTQPISYMQGGASARSTESSDEGDTIIFPYIIGAFNMMIAILSALHTFLKYDALEDRHHQYSRHFANLQVDLETLLAKPHDQRGDVGTMVERYKTKYAVLINNAPDLSERLERKCCGSEQIIPTTCETPRKISGYSFSD